MVMRDSPLITKEVIGQRNIKDDILFARNIAKKIYREMILNWVYKNSDLNRFEPVFTIMDCEQAAYSGLFDAYKRYDPSKRSFKNFAYKRIKGEVLDQIMKSLPITRSIFKNMKKKKESSPKTYSLENTIDEESDAELKDVIRAEIDSYFNQIDNIDEISFLLRGFSENERKIFIYRNLCNHTLEQAAKRVGVSKQTAWFIHPRVMERLHEKVKERNLSYIPGLKNFK